MPPCRLFTRPVRALVAALSFGMLVLSAPPVSAVPLLGSAQNFSVLGASAVSNTGFTTLVGDLGLYPGTAITGLATVTLTGTVHRPTRWRSRRKPMR